MNLDTLKNDLFDDKMTLIPLIGLENIEFVLRDVKENGIKGDFVETGVWQGGACIYARAVMNELKLEGNVYVCDSFEGLPKPDTKNFPQDDGDGHYQIDVLRVSQETVTNNFLRYDLLGGVKFVKGWFKDTMPVLKNELKSVAVLRLDGDMYESTVEVLNNLYDLVPIGGYIIIDDYCLSRCKIAVDEFLKKKQIDSPFISIDQCIHYWK